MTNFSPVAPGTGSVLVASSAQSSDASTVAALQQLTAAVANLSQAQGKWFLQSATQTAAAPAVAPPLAPDTAPATAPNALAPPGIIAPSGFLTHGPWVVGGLYIVVPTSPLMAIVEEDAEGKLWYCITRGKFVGITTSNALALRASVHVSGSSMKGHKTQSLAVLEFNDMLRYQMVVILA